MNNDLISRSALIAFLEENHTDRDWLVNQYNADWICSWIESQPAADVAPVVHGRCDYCKDGKSFIGQTIMIANDGKCHTIRYCPNCGADMRERKGDDAV